MVCHDGAVAVPVIPAPRWNHQTTTIAASLPLSISLVPHPYSQSSMTLQLKSSLIEGQSVLVPPLKQPIATDSVVGERSERRSGARMRSKSFSSVARDRTYAERDVQRSQDPGDALGVPDEEDEEEEVLGEDEIEEKGRRNAFKILNRQSDVPDETMWRSVAG
ncbi:uncharacterized protein EI90DRAFT_3039835 [Cantharellus anzutake]|uniref:uncharacterized protein n=1 Tax=Cantharellus anzutake TaxID=1750568 RepID=UPI001906DFCD|nr:uncharacterized protein EI90DRAFT_3039835 [Cantharellus anzutake]KAF8338963.1 hypothetical protein EI90DRAFT_3039835 [Cantharellus anzutake]